MLKLTLFTAVLMASGTSALAQQQPVGAGGQLRQIPPAAVPKRSIPEIRVETPQPGPSQASDGEKVLVNALRVSGNTLFSEAELIAAAQAPVGREATLGELRAAAQRISAYYNAHGYFVAQAYLPAQEINDGSVTIAVVEGRYDKVTLRNQTNVADRVPNGILSGLNTGDMVANKPLERRLLLLSDLPGVEVRSTLTPGAAVGATDLIVDMTPGRRIDGVVEADNAGNRYTGAYRAGATVNFNEPLGQGDVASLRVLASDGGFYYGRASYEMQVDKARVGVAYAALKYKLGREFKALDATGTASIATLYGSYPLIRSYDNNLYALANVEAKSFRDKVGATSSVTDRSAEVVNVGFSGDHTDRIGGGGWTYYAANMGFGDLDIETPAARAIDAATARTNGRYNKLSFDLARLQTISGPLSMYVAIGGQVASKNLDSSEKMELGGAYGVRAYPEGEAYGDQGYLANIEARYLLTQVSARVPGDLQLVAFVDAGRITSNKNNWGAGPNHRTLSGAGVGVIWTANNDFMVKASYARKLGDQVAISAPDRSGRFWIQVSKFF
jgi:hemolysin activation/secretion protein